MSSSTGISEEAMEVLRQASTGVVVDALGMAGVQGAVMGIRPVRGFEEARVVGPAATVLYAPARPDSPRLSNYNAISASPAGSVLVIDGKGSTDHFYTGDNQAEYAQLRGLVGFVVYGGVRDLVSLREIGLPVWSTGSAPRPKPSDMALTAHNVPIEVGGVLIRPGDIIVADEDGVAVIPAEVLDRVVANVKAMFEVEEVMKNTIRGGASADEIVATLAREKARRR